MSDMYADYYEDFLPMTQWEDFDEEDFEQSAAGLEAGNAEAAALELLEFIENTPDLMASEQAEVFGAFIEDARRSGGPRSGEVDWGRIARGVQTGLSLFQTGAQVAGGIAGAVGGNNRTARDIALWSRRLGQGAGFAQNLLGNIRGGQAPRLPTGVQHRVPPRYYPARPPTRTAAPARTRPAAPAAVRGLPLNNTAQIASLLNNPQIMQALRSALFRRREGSLRIEASISDGSPVSIPLADVMDMVARLAQESALELKALSGGDAEEIPSYLVGEDGEYVIEPESAEDRDALVLAELRYQRELERYDEPGGFDAIEGVAMDAMSESDVWAREAGFDG